MSNDNEGNPNVKTQIDVNVGINPKTGVIQLEIKGLDFEQAKRWAELSRPLITNFIAKAIVPEATDEEIESGKREATAEERKLFVDDAIVDDCDCPGCRARRAAGISMAAMPPASVN